MAYCYNQKYKQISKLGNGSQGVVYLCEDICSKKKVAVKCFIENRMESIQNELKAIINLNNQFIVKYLDHFIEGPIVGIVMVYCEQGDLAEKIKKTSTKFDENKIFQWTYEMTEGMCYLHSNQIIHRDIKPSNVFLTNKDHIKLGDLGVCRIINDDSTGLVSTHVGTGPYMSPEMEKDSQYSYETDIWSTGCTVYELITLKKYKSNKPLNNDESSLNELNKLLKIMLIENPKERVSSKELKKQIEHMKKKRLSRNPTENDQTEPFFEPFLNQQAHSLKSDFKLETKMELSPQWSKKIDKKLTSHKNSVQSVTVLKCQSIASGDANGDIKIWDSNDAYLIRTIPGYSSKAIKYLAVLEDGRLVSASEDNTLAIWNPNTGRSFRALIGHIGTVNCVVALNKDRLVSCSCDKTIIVWDTETGKPIKKLIGHKHWILSLAILDKYRLASGSYDGEIKIWNSIETNEIVTLKESNKPISFLLRLSEKKLASSSSEDKVISIWNIESGTVLVKLVGHTDYVCCLVLLKNEMVFASGSCDKTIRLWNIEEEDGLLIAVLRGHMESVNSLALLEDGRLVSGSNDNTVIIWK